MTQHEEWWFPFVPAEWWKDEALSMASAVTRSLWWEIFLRLSVAGRSSYNLPVRRWAKLARADKEDWQQMVMAIHEIAELGIADVWVEDQTEDDDGKLVVTQTLYTRDSPQFVPNENTCVTIMSRRLDAKYQKTEFERVKKAEQRRKKRVSPECPPSCPPSVPDTRARARSNSNSRSLSSSVSSIDNESEQGGGQKGGGGFQDDPAGQSAVQPTAGVPSPGSPASGTHSTATPDPAAEVDAVVAWWLAAGKNPRDRTALEKRTRNSIARHLQDHPVDDILQAVDRIHADSPDLRYIVHIANAFGQQDKIAPYYADDWTPARDAPTKAKPTPKPGPEKLPEPIVPEGLDCESARWANALGVLQNDFDKGFFDAWFSPLVMLGAKDGTHYIETPSKWVRGWVVRERHHIEEAMKLGDEEEIVFTVAQVSEEEDDAKET